MACVVVLPIALAFEIRVVGSKEWSQWDSILHLEVWLVVPWGASVVGIAVARECPRNHCAHVGRILLCWSGVVLPLVVFSRRT